MTVQTHVTIAVFDYGDQTKAAQPIAKHNLPPKDSRYRCTNRASEIDASPLQIRARSGFAKFMSNVSVKRPRQGALGSGKCFAIQRCRLGP